MKLVNHETLAAALVAAWPTHIEGSGGVPDVPTSNWRVYDPAYPSDDLAAAILAAIPPDPRQEPPLDFGEQWTEKAAPNDLANRIVREASERTGDVRSDRPPLGASVAPDPRLDALLAAASATLTELDIIRKHKRTTLMVHPDTHGDLRDALAAFEEPTP